MYISGYYKLRKDSLALGEIVYIPADARAVTLHPSSYGGHQVLAYLIPTDAPDDSEDE